MVRKVSSFYNMYCGSVVLIHYCYRYDTVQSDTPRTEIVLLDPKTINLDPPSFGCGNGVCVSFLSLS